MIYADSIDELLPRYLDLWRRLGVHAGDAMPAGLSLLEAYNDIGRAYHNLTHLADVLEKLDWAKTALVASGDIPAGNHDRMFDRIELALFYHDAVYVAKAKDNEAQSRDLFIADAKRFGLPQEDIDAVARLIDLTANHGRASALDEKIMSDCDLAILGAPRGEFNTYDRNIRREYSDIPAPFYNTRRAEVMKTFLDLPRLFKTEAFHQRFDAQARKNLHSITTPSPAQKIFSIFKR